MRENNDKIIEENIDNTIDLNIDNYNFKEMINIFNISPNLNYEDNSILYNTIQDLNNNSQNFDNNFIVLVKKIFVILNVLSKYKDYQLINKSDYTLNEDHANDLIIKIKNIDNFEHLNPKYIIQLLLINKDDKFNIFNEKNDNNMRENIFQNNQKNNNQTNNNQTNNNQTNNDQIFNNFNNSIVPGTINSIKRISKFTNLHINTLFRNNYYKSSSTNFTYTLPNTYHNVVSINLNSIELKQTWLPINQKNNFFYIEVNSKKHKIELDIINANKNLEEEIKIQLVNLLNNQDINISLKFIKINDNLQSTNIEIINSLNNIDIIFFEESDNNNFLNSLGWILGFRNSKYKNLISNKILKSETFINLNPIDSIYLSINDYQYNYNETNVVCFDKTSLDDHILAKLSLSENSKFIYINSSNHERNKLSNRTYNGPINLTKIEVKLYDKFGNILDNQNCDYSFSLQLEILYENNNVLKLN
jgi:hypothetical protein